jgi:hypothetical protein
LGSRKLTRDVVVAAAVSGSARCNVLDLLALGIEGSDIFLLYILKVIFIHLERYTLSEMNDIQYVQKKRLKFSKGGDAK